MSADASGAPPVALVTGAASGMGLALTQHLVSKGWRVGMCDINSAAGLQHSKALNSTPHPFDGGTRTLFRKVDITDYIQQAAFFKEVFNWSSPRRHIDYFAANAGIMDVGSLFKDAKRMPLDEKTGLPLPPSTKPVAINLRAVLEGIWLYRFFHAQHRQSGATKLRGRITITASSVGFYPFHGQVQYTATKHALIGVVRSSAVPLRRENISINAICPAFVDTPLLPPDFAREWPKEHLVSMATVMRAHDLCVGDGVGREEVGVLVDGNGKEVEVQKAARGKRKSGGGGMMTGETIELSQESMFFRRAIGYPNESQRWFNEDSAQYFRDIERQKAEHLKGWERETKL